MGQTEDYIQLKRQLGKQVKLLEEIVHNVAHIYNDIKVKSKLTMDDRVRKYKIYLKFRRRQQRMKKKIEISYNTKKNLKLQKSINLPDVEIQTSLQQDE